MYRHEPRDIVRPFLLFAGLHLLATCLVACSDVPTLAWILHAPLMLAVMLLNESDSAGSVGVFVLVSLLLMDTCLYALGLAIVYRGFVPATSGRRRWHCKQCGFNLTGTLKARGASCPECGQMIEDSSAEQ